MDSTGCSSPLRPCHRVDAAAVAERAGVVAAARMDCGMYNSVHLGESSVKLPADLGLRPKAQRKQSRREIPI